MFSVREKRLISDAIQQILRATNHPELPYDEIEFTLHVDGIDSDCWADIANNGSCKNPSINQHNEDLDKC
jgi:hypothetical protein